MRPCPHACVQRLPVNKLITKNVTFDIGGGGGGGSGFCQPRTIFSCNVFVTEIEKGTEVFFLRINDFLCMM